MKFNFIHILFYINVYCILNVVCFRLPKHRNLAYNSYNQMKRKLNYSLEDESSTPVVEDNPYRFVNGYRLVVPYQNIYKTFVKKRWMGKQLYNVLTDEFGAFTEEYIKYASSKNKIKVFDKDNNDLYTNQNGNVLDHVLKPNERILHYASVHEPIATNTKIKVLQNLDDYIFVSKPTSIPVYRTGTYRYNTLIEIMKRELECCKDIGIYAVHRIDKLVSGVVAFGKTPKAASTLSQAIKDRKVKKVYIARVCGNFSEFVNKSENILVHENEYKNGRVVKKEELKSGDEVENKYEQQQHKGDESDRDNEHEDLLRKIVTHEGYMHTVSKKYSKNEFTKEALDDSYKHSITRFRFLSYNPEIDESLILVSPVTGRTHQIRAHLKYLGYSITNDPCYNNGRCEIGDEYFQKIPIINWQINDEGNWCIPEIGLFDNSENKPNEENSVYHIGLNNRGDLKAFSCSGIYLHALRIIWNDHFDVCDSLPKWIDKFDLKAVDVTKLRMW